MIASLRQPFDTSMERALQLLMHSAPPRRALKRSLIDKTCFVASTIFYTAIIPLSVALFGVAALLDTVRQRWSPSRFTYWEGRGEEKSGRLESVFTWNVCMLFGGLPIPFGGVAPVPDRVNEVAAKILASNADVVVLQEVSDPAARLLYEEMKGKYRHFYTGISPETVVGLHSALFFASKMPVTDPRVIDLPRSGLMHRAAFLSKIGGVNVVATHLEPGQTEEDAITRKAQIDVISRECIVEDTVVAGDLNMERESEFFGSALSFVFSDVIFPEQITATDVFTARNRNIPRANQSIDYILGSDHLLDRVKVLKGFELDKWASSDHHPLQGYLVNHS